MRVVIMPLQHDPFAHVILADTVPADLVVQASAEWPSVEWPSWLRYDSPLERKRTCNDWKSFPPAVRRLMGELLVLPVWQWLGLPHAVPDSLLFGGGMHDMRAGDHLDVHLDHDRHALTGLERACNAILFLSEGWSESWGGRLCLWDEGLTRPRVRIEPKAGRLVCFATDDVSYHGVERVACPPDQARKTLALYWYIRPRGVSKRPRAQFVAVAGEGDDADLRALRRFRVGGTAPLSDPLPPV
jgi:hypothetical protein